MNLPAPKRNPCRLLTAGTVLGLLAYFVWTVVRHHYVRAYSDPHNWLVFAHNFGQEVLRSRWPYAFPLFLKMAMAVVGPYAVFLVNLPLLVLIFLMVKRLGDHLDGEGGGEGPSSGLFAFVLVVSADAYNLVHYANPFRDPLSYVFLFASMLSFVAALRARRAAGLFASGALLGLACSVREPSVLALGPFLLFGLAEQRRSGGGIRLVPSMAAFAAGLVLALVPLAVQTYLATSQMVLPPQAAMESSVVPGAHFNRFMLARTGGRALRFYWQTQSWILALALVGLAGAVRGKRRVAVLLVAPALAVYALFYSYYWIFVARYFYVATLLLCVLAGHGAAILYRVAARRFPERLRFRLAVATVLAMALLSAFQLGRVQNPEPPFQIAHARALAQRLDPVLPENAVVFAPRNLCELFQAVVRRTSHPLPIHLALDRSPAAALREHVEALRADGRPVFAADVAGGGDAYAAHVHLRKLYDFAPVADVDPAEFRIAGYAPGRLVLHRLDPWSRRLPELDVPARGFRSGAGWAMVDWGYLSANNGGAPNVSVSIGGRPASVGALPDGAQIWEMPGGSDSVRVTCESAGVLPAAPRLQAGDVSAPIELVFEFNSPFDNLWRWGEGARLPTLDARWLRLASAADFAVPVPAPHRGRVVMEWQVKSAADDSAPPDVLSFHEGAAHLGDRYIPRDGRVHSRSVALPANRAAPERRVRLSRPGATNDAPALEIHALLLHRVAAAPALDLRIGTDEDFPYLVSGLHRREGGRARNPYRWTEPRAELGLPGLDAAADMELQVHYSVEHVPAELRSGDVGAEWNGLPLEPAEIQSRKDGMERVWTARIPADRISHDNALSLSFPAWRPRDHGSPDSRELGVVLRRIRWQPLADSAGGAP